MNHHFPLTFPFKPLPTHTPTQQSPRPCPSPRAAPPAELVFTTALRPSRHGSKNSRSAQVFRSQSDERYTENYQCGNSKRSRKHDSCCSFPYKITTESKNVPRAEQCVSCCLAWMTGLHFHKNSAQRVSCLKFPMLYFSLSRHKHTQVPQLAQFNRHHYFLC